MYLFSLCLVVLSSRIITCVPVNNQRNNNDDKLVFPDYNTHLTTSRPTRDVLGVRSVFSTNTTTTTNRRVFNTTPAVATLKSTGIKSKSTTSSYVTTKTTVMAARPTVSSRISTTTIRNRINPTISRSSRNSTTVRSLISTTVRSRISTPSSTTTESPETVTIDPNCLNSTTADDTDNMVFPDENKNSTKPNKCLGTRVMISAPVMGCPEGFGRDRHGGCRRTLLRRGAFPRN